ncbi:Dabb family protein [Oscillibacter sp.]|uniref:Dabb family protein n=1 Tax=Oscillibacter sp. TaxID=1945593 RepID=UPI0026055155|nr:Dabb family protein [Oscillibacter sp.]MDD3347302.1 Dabb family protein [Oscillibacter sp.]
MIRHIVMWKFRPDTEAEQALFLDGLRSLQGVIPQLLRSEVSMNVGKGNYDAVLVSEFESLEALEAYKNDPRHQAVSALCKSIREQRAAVDSEIFSK